MSVGEAVDLDRSLVMAQFERDAAYFVTHQGALRRDYPDQWIAIYGERIAATASDRDGLLQNLCKRGVPAEHAFVQFLETTSTLLIV